MPSAHVRREGTVSLQAHITQWHDRLKSDVAANGENAKSSCQMPANRRNRKDPSPSGGWGGGDNQATVFPLTSNWMSELRKEMSVVSSQF